MKTLKISHMVILIRSIMYPNVTTKISLWILVLHVDHIKKYLLVFNSFGDNYFTIFMPCVIPPFS